MIKINYIKIFEINKCVTPDIRLYFSGNRYCFIELGYFYDLQFDKWRKEHITFGSDNKDFYAVDLSQRYKNLYDYRD